MADEKFGERQSFIISKMTDELKRADTRLREISEDLADTRYGEGAWTRKELLGHLIDSATNNRYQIVKTLVDGSYTGPSYKQEEWVRAHRYSTIPWEELRELWWAENLLLAKVIGGITNEQWAWTCAVGTDVNGTLRSRVNDYLGHLEHHLGQM